MTKRLGEEVLGGGRLGAVVEGGVGRGSLDVCELSRDVGSAAGTN